MKRKNAILLFGTFTLLLGGHTAWALRPFYLKPAIVIDRRLPYGAVETMLQWEVENDFLKPQAFSWMEFCILLIHPWQADVRTAEVKYLTEPRYTQTRDGLYIREEGIGWIDSRELGVVTFAVNGGGCRFVKKQTINEFNVRF